MRSLSIQVQPERSPRMDMAALSAAFEALGRNTALVEHHKFDSGRDGVPYVNFTFGTRNAKELWLTIQALLYHEGEAAEHMRLASMAMCSSEEGWDDYLLLHHFDPTVAIDDAAAL